jgi:eukaryotic-like serine/threonine-protein kinase
VALGRSEDAVRHIQASRDLDPLSTRANNDVGWLQLFIRQPGLAARACQHTLALDSSSLEAQACLERAYAQQRRFDAAVDAARATLLSTAEAPVVSRGAGGLQEIWKWRVQRLEHAAASRWVNPYTLAVHYALVGERDRAIAALERAHATRVGMMVFLARDPAFDSLHGLPRFEALLRSISEPTS